MEIQNLDYECYLTVSNFYRNYQDDWLKVGYAPLGYYLKDFCLFEQNGVYHLFHIAGTPGVTCCVPGNEIWLGHATTKDFVSWQTHAPCLYINPDSWDSGQIFAPYVIEKDGKFWMFYTGCPIGNTQRIGVAVSDNLFDWKRPVSKPIIRPEEYSWAFCPTEKGSACRDPHICQMGDEYWMYYTAVTNKGHGCVARASSRDLIHWLDCGPSYEFSEISHCESSNVQKLGDKYLLFFGGHHEYWSYVISDNPESWPSQEPKKLEKAITAMEVVKRCDSRWLVAYFRFDAYRMFLGIIDWSSQDPKIEQISIPEELKEFGF